MKKICEVAIIGGGAAGLMAGIFCAREGLKTRVFEGGREPGAKILISGGGHCNITNLRVSERDYGTESPRAVRHVLAGFPPGKTVSFFREIGVPLCREPDGEYYPESRSSRAVRDGLLKALRGSGAELLNGSKVSDIAHDGTGFCLKSGGGDDYFSGACLIATGGLSYPWTGSDGSGYGFALKFGHSLVPTSPALTPLTTDHAGWTGLSGISLAVCLQLWSEAKQVRAFEGPLLFTHFGFSGPAALNMSRHWFRRRESPGTKILASFLPGITAETLLDEHKTLRVQMPGKTLKKVYQPRLPNRLLELLLRESGIPQGRVLGEMTKPELRRWVRVLTACPLPVSGVCDYRKAEATAGGVPLGELDPVTLESRKRPGLFFAGEVLDADGRIGGFNFQWAWASAAAAARGMARKTTPPPP